MNRPAPAWLLVAFLATSSQPLGAQTRVDPNVGPAVAPVVGRPVPTQAATMASLAFMAGCWRSEPDEEGVVIEERYTPPATNLMLGTTRYLRAGSATSFEFTRISSNDGGIVMVPYPNGRASSDPFQLTSAADDEAVFEAPEHDFPKRIVYRLDLDGALIARIDDATSDGRAFTWRMLATACTGP